MHILITGYSGFIGKNLLPKLKGNKITCLGRASPKDKNINYIPCDLSKKLKKDLIPKDIDVVIHLIGGGNVSSISEKDHEVLKNLNVSTTKNLINALPKGVKKFIYLSSISAMGVFDEIVVSESTKDNPIIPHELCKKEAEDVVRKSNVPYIILRPPAVYGPHAKYSDILLMSKVIDILGIFPVLGDGKNHVPYIYVENLINAIVLCIKSKKTNKTYVVTQLDNPTFNKLVSSVGSKFLFHIPIILVYPLVYIVEKLCVSIGITPPINTHRLKSMTSDRKFDISLIQKDLGYKQEYTFAKGLKKTIKWYKDNDVI